MQDEYESINFWNEKPWIEKQIEIVHQKMKLNMEKIERSFWNVEGNSEGMRLTEERSRHC